MSNGPLTSAASAAAVVIQNARTQVAQARKALADAEQGLSDAIAAARGDVASAVKTLNVGSLATIEREVTAAETAVRDELAHVETTVTDEAQRILGQSPWARRVAVAAGIAALVFVGWAVGHMRSAGL